MSCLSTSVLRILARPDPAEENSNGRSMMGRCHRHYWWKSECDYEKVLILRGRAMGVTMPTRARDYEAGCERLRTTEGYGETTMQKQKMRRRRLSVAMQGVRTTATTTTTQLGLTIVEGEEVMVVVVVVVVVVAVAVIATSVGSSDSG